MDRYPLMAYKVCRSQQAVSQYSDKVVQLRTRGQCTIVHKAPEAEGKARESSNIVYRTI